MNTPHKSDSVEVVPESPKSEVALREEAVLAFWREHDVFNTSINKEAPNGDFVFYDGPPFATGLPHYGHILAGTIKDAIPRFWTMNGYRVRRKWGWDCHGLPLENLIEKKLGLATKRDIEEYGVKNFNEAAREAVLEYADDWKRIIPRMGRWADMDDDYKTMDATYTESVWWVFSELNKKGLVYEGFKSMHLCPRCGTTLSNFEVNQGYKDIKDIAVTVKLPLVEMPNTSLLVWTTTPWTLPGNMAAAVHNDIDYVKVRVVSEAGEDLVILAKARLSQLGELKYEVLEEMKGSALVGASYVPPFDSWQKQDFAGKEHAWKIYHADYVELGEEGTGAVHLAPAYGEEDMELAKREGVPIMHHVDASGHFLPFVEGFNCELVKPKDDDEANVTHLDTDIEVVKRLKESGRLMKKENITHSYPHCWRCDTPLLNYATTSWFVKVTDIKDQLVAENAKVHWVPEHVGSARFGKWLEGARDWAVSRQRYWGAPLPVWRNPTTKAYKVFGSLAELQSHVPKSGNKYFIMRHAESTKNTLDIVTDQYDAPYPLTEKGRADAKEVAATIKERVDLIITSPVLRALDTAKIIAEELGIPATQIVVDERIRETGHGEYEGRSFSEYKQVFPSDMTKFTNKPEGGESWGDLRARMGAFIYSLEEDHKGKNILIVSHGDPLTMLLAAASGVSNEAALSLYEDHYPQKGEVRELSFVPMPHNDNYELDFHRPYIDDFAVFDTDGTKLQRVPDVFDCWFESGSMPYGQVHYPFSCTTEEFQPKYFPAQFIAEGLDQTRGWFYSLIVLGTALFGKSPYQNVIVNGLVLAEDGKKMSKKLQNYPDPMELADRVGVDAIRHYLLSAPIMRGEDLNFSEKEVLELQRKNIGRLHNVLAMYEQYADGTPAAGDSANVLDRWILARLNELIKESTTGYRNYELDKATRPITDFIDDLSVWYLRRSRERLKGEDMADKTLALGTLRFVLRELALVMAPAMPFYAEYLWGRVREEREPESVHLASWPNGGSVDDRLIADMQELRRINTLALEARTKSKINVRQPLALLSVKPQEPSVAYLYDILKSELNVKEVADNAEQSEDVALDTTITPALKREGSVRELMRSIQDTRKAMGLNPKDQVTLTVDQTTKELIAGFEAQLQSVVGARSIEIAEAQPESLVLDGTTFSYGVAKV